MWHTDMWHNGDWAWGMWFMPLIWFLVLAAIVVGVIFLVRAVNRSQSSPAGETTAAERHAPPPVEDPREILKRRYVRGEIDRDEYLQKRDDLEP